MAKPIGLGRHVTFSACQGQSGSVGEIHSLETGGLSHGLPITELAVRVVARELTSHKGTYVRRPSITFEARRGRRPLGLCVAACGRPSNGNAGAGCPPDVSSQGVDCRSDWFSALLLKDRQKGGA